jgi:putative hemolysin
MSNIGFEVLVIFFLIVGHGVLVLSEIAVIKARKSRLQELANKGNAKARAALELADSPTQLLSTVQMGITFIGVLAGAYGGRTVADRLAGYLNTIPVLEPYSPAIALAAVVIGITYLSLIIGQLIPKRLALSNPEAIVLALAAPMQALSAVAFLAVRLLSVSTDAIFRLFGKGPHQEPPVTEEEIRTLVQQGTEAGVFEESEQDMVEAVFRLGDKTAPALMTPRSQIIWLDLNDSPKRTREKITQSGHSRFPVGTGGLDNVVGIAQAKDLLAHVLAGEPVDLKASLQQPFFVPRSMPALQLLEQFKQSGKHIALVVDEYGGIEGLLTHHDILEAIAGEIPFGGTPPEPKAVQRHDGSWLLDGMLSVEEFKEIFHLESLPGENRDAYQTLGGFLFTQMGRVPTVSDQFDWGNLRFEIVDMDGKRIDKVLVSSSQINAGAAAPQSSVHSPGQSSSSDPNFK